MRLPGLVSLTIVVAFLAAGCGGGGRPKKLDFLSSADTICAQATQQVQHLLNVTQKRKRLSRTDFASLLNRLASIEDQSLRELRGLKTPKGDDAKIQSLFGLFGKTNRLTRQAAGALRKNDQKAYARLRDDALRAQAKAAELASNYGFTACGIPAGQTGG